MELLTAMAELSPSDDFVVFPISWRTATLLELPDRANIDAVRKFAPARPLQELWDRVPFPPLELFVRADVFHATNFLSPPARRIPTIATVHDLGFLRFPELTPGRERALVRLLPRTLKRASAIITVSKFTATELGNWMPSVIDKVVVVPNGAHMRSLPPPEGINDKPYALVLGTMNPRKNIPLALDALAVLRHRGVELDLVLAGAETPGFDIRPLVAERGLDANVTVTGYIDDTAAAKLLANARVFAFPSKYEGFGMPLIEAMHAGIPIVAADAGATPETVGDAAVLVADDPGAFAEALERAAFDDATRARLIESGRHRASEFSWPRAAAATLDVYRSVSS